MTEKRIPHYSLEEIQAAFSTVDGLKMTRAAFDGANEVGLDNEGVIGVIQSMQRNQFYKSMTSYVDHKVWQDVYHVPSVLGMLYVKFTVKSPGGFMLLSFKEK